MLAVMMFILIFLLLIFLVARSVYIMSRCTDSKTGNRVCYKCGKFEDPIWHDEGSLYYWCREHVPD